MRPEIQYFLDLAKTGQAHTASGGEKRCARIAQTLLGQLEDIQGIDPEAQAGICAIIQEVGRGKFFEMTAALEDNLRKQ